MGTAQLDGDGDEFEADVALISEDHRGQYPAAVRLVVDPGLRWLGVEYHEQSLRELDDWSGATEPPSDTGRPIDLVDARHWAPRLDGVRVALCGQQSRLQQVASTDDHVEWVFHMESNQNRAIAFSYVRARLSSAEPPPRAPEDHITWASGYFVARGTAVSDDPATDDPATDHTDPPETNPSETSQSDINQSGLAGRSCLYLVADRVFFTPKAQSRKARRASRSSRIRSAFRRS